MSEDTNAAGGARPADIDEEELTHHRRLIVGSGKQVLYAGAHIDSNVWPCITIGCLKNGQPLMHFRNYRATGRDAWIIRREGASFTLPEVATAIQRLCALFPYVPELLQAMQQMKERPVGRT